MSHPGTWAANVPTINSDWTSELFLVVYRIPFFFSFDFEWKLFHSHFYSTYCC